MNPFLEAFLLFDVFLAGVLVTLAVQHARAHYRPVQHEDEKPSHSPVQNNSGLSPAMRKQMQETAQANFQKVLNRSAMELQHDLAATEVRLNHKLDRLGSEIVSKEMERYQKELDQLREKAEATTKGAESGLAEHQAELKAQLDADIAAEKQRLLQQLDTKLADAVTSFLLETLQHDVDLGAQSAYLTKMLEEHKDELAKGVASER